MESLDALTQIVLEYQSRKNSFYKEELALDKEETCKMREVIEAMLTFDDKVLIKLGVDVDELHAFLLDDTIFPEENRLYSKAM